MQYVDIIEDGSEIVRGMKSKQTTDQIQLRLDWTFSPDLTFQGFSTFYADIKYDNAQFVSARNYEFRFLCYL